MVDRSPERRRPRLTLLAAVTAAAVAGCSSGTPAPAGPDRVSTAPTAAAATAATSAPGGAAAATIPASAFYAMPADMRHERQKADGSAAVPRLCDGELAAGDGVVASAAVMSLYQQPDDPPGSVPQGTLYQTIRSYRGDSAAAFMDRARDGLAGCESFRSGGNTVSVRTEPLSGVADEGLTIDLVQPQQDLPGDPTGGEQTNRVVVLRSGPVVTVLYDAEYERSSSRPELVDRFADGAAKAIRAWRG
jgi:hypothetical protein